MLAMEADDLIDVSTKYVDEHSVEEFYDNVFIPALQLSEEDRKNGSLAEERQIFIAQSAREVIEELERREEVNKAAEAKKAAPSIPLAQPHPAVVGIPARDDADEIVGLMLAHLLRRQGIHATVRSLAHRADQSESIGPAQMPQAVFVSSLPPSAVTTARQACRRLNAQFPDVPLLVGVWNHQGEVNVLKERLRPVVPESVVKKVEDGCREIARITNSLPPAVDAPPPAVLKAVASAAAH
jgi:hypothetical protein